MRTTNDELLTAREFRRGYAAHLERLEAGDVEKLVLAKGAELRFVILRADDFEKLTEGGMNGGGAKADVS